MNAETILATARRVISHEARALDLLSAGIGEGFAEAAETILQAKGRVIVSGIGKSGHIARKIAATLASTGTPAYFVHPAEASHGDLGMVTSDDVALAISNSGEAPELSDLVAYTRRFDIPLIAITSKPEASLARQSDIVLLLPTAEEACTTGIVPTTSTAMTLALGDALALALMENRAFTVENFRDFHPGGKLGARLARVRDLMHSRPPLIGFDKPMGEALLIMTSGEFGGSGVVGATDNDGKLCGIITDGDLRRHLDGLMTMRVRDVMTVNPMTIAPDELAVEAVGIMNDRKITSLFVVAEDAPGTCQGILRIHDCLKAGVV